MTVAGYCNSFSAAFRPRQRGGLGRNVFRLVLRKSGMGPGALQEPDQIRQDRIYRSGYAEGLPLSHNCSVDVLDFRSAPGDHVLEHGRLVMSVVIQCVSDRMCYAIPVDGNPGRFGNICDFVSCLFDEPVTRLGVKSADRQTCHSRNGIHGGVEGNLFPDPRTDIWILLNIEPGLGEQGTDLLRELGVSSRIIADRNRRLAMRGNSIGADQIDWKTTPPITAEVSMSRTALTSRPKRPAVRKAIGRARYMITGRISALTRPMPMAKSPT